MKMPKGRDVLFTFCGALGAVFTGVVDRHFLQTTMTYQLQGGSMIAFTHSGSECREAQRMVRSSEYLVRVRAPWGDRFPVTDIDCGAWNVAEAPP